jgi:cytochrome d ubiquinol oxidase subunit II
VWLIFILVVAWSAFPDAFAAAMSTLFVPLILAALGVVLRGAGFAFRAHTHRLAERRAYGAVFALSSVLTPFFLGTAAGAIAGGRVPADGDGDRLTSWLNLTSITVGVLFVAACGYLAAVFLVADARRAGDETLVEYFRRRALAAAGVTGVLAALGLVVLRDDARPLFDGLFDEALPVVILSALCGLGVLALLLRGAPRGTRPLAVLAVAAVVWGWGVAQYPDILPGALTVEQAAAPDGTMTALFIVFAAAAVWVVPAMALLYALHQRSALEEGASAEPFQGER